MLEQLKYVNHLGEELIFGDWNGLYVNINELHDFRWEQISSNERISGFERKIQERRIPIRILCKSAAEGLELRDKLFEIPEKDILKAQYGKLWINDYYCECWITASSKTDYSIDGKYMACNLTITTDKPYWVREVSEMFWAIDSDSDSEFLHLDYPHDYPFDYKALSAQQSSVMNTGFFESKFKLIINGPAVNPTIFINDHMYQVNQTVGSDEYLTIDSNDKTILLTQIDGVNLNVFDKRNRDNYIFKMIASGIISVVWDNSFDFSLTLYDERSEPKWSAV